ncbi:MAG: sigma 54-interacting transcriptional regulator [Thermodesulfobacteriota bacterium]|nr:sigma 54-interacting transcriptional regulator [Thermodesulfobacteriota bacterium]
MATHSLNDTLEDAQNAPLDLFKSFALEHDPDKLQRKFLFSLLKLQKVDRGSIWIKNNDGYTCIEAVGHQSNNIKGITLAADQKSIVGWVIENGQMTVADPISDPRHFRQLEKNLAVKSSLILCFPLYNNNTVYGAVQVIDTSPHRNRLNLEQEYLNQLQNLIDIGSITIGNMLQYNTQVQRAARLEDELKEIRKKSRFIGQSRGFRKSLELIDSYAVTDYPVLITGESGTGKDLAAARIHNHSSRRGKPFLVQNCSAIPEALLESELFGYKKGAFTGATKDKIGIFEAADGGTVFLDEIGDMPIALQASLLRVIQNSEIKPVGANTTRRVDIRIITATNKHIEELVTRSIFRKDLFFRISVLPVHLPPLRKRKEDIPILANYLLKREALRLDVPVKNLNAEVLELFMAYSWPGNVRELENTIRYLLTVTEKTQITADMIPARIKTNTHAINDHELVPAPPATSGKNQRHPTGFFTDQTWRDIERAYVHHLLETHKWNITQCARTAGLNRSTFDSRLKRLGIRKNQ